MRVTIFDYGAGNLHSLAKAIERGGVDVHVETDPVRAVDTDALVTEWMRGVYGAAWQPMRRWLDLQHEKVRAPEAHFGISDAPGQVPFLTAGAVAEGDRLKQERERIGLTVADQTLPAKQRDTDKGRVTIEPAEPLWIELAVDF